MLLTIWFIAVLVFGFIAGNNTRNGWYHDGYHCGIGVRFCCGIYGWFYF